MYSSDLLRNIETHVQSLFATYDTSKLLYHDLAHTERVVGYVQKLADHYNLSTHSAFIVTTAAWFHDTGHLKGVMAVHEETSVQFMNDFFRDKNLDIVTATSISQIIMATKMPVAPSTQLEKIICDADTWHLGTDDFQHLDQWVWNEIEVRQGKLIENKLQKTLQFLESHQFYTDYCIARLSVGKSKNIELIKSMLTRSTLKT